MKTKPNKQIKNKTFFKISGKKLASKATEKKNKTERNKKSVCVKTF